MPAEDLKLIWILLLLHWAVLKMWAIFVEKELLSTYLKEFLVLNLLSCGLSLTLCVLFYRVKYRFSACVFLFFFAWSSHVSHLVYTQFKKAFSAERSTMP